MKTLKVLLIEDDPKEVENIKKGFAKADDIKIVGVADGQTDAIYMLKRERPDVVIVDITLREGHGAVFVSQLFEQAHLDYKPKVIVVTQTQSDELHDMLYSHGVSYIFGKYEEDYSVDLILEFLREIYDDIPRLRLI